MYNIYFLFVYGVLELPWNLRTLTIRIRVTLFAFFFFFVMGGGGWVSGPWNNAENFTLGGAPSPKGPAAVSTLTVRLGATLTVRLGATAGWHVDVASSVQTVGQRGCREKLRLVKLPQLECKPRLI